MSKQTMLIIAVVLVLWYLNSQKPEYKKIGNVNTIMDKDDK